MYECVFLCVPEREKRGAVFVHATPIHHARDGEKFKGSNNNGDCDLHERWREGLKENERYKEPNERRVRERERGERVRERET